LPDTVIELAIVGDSADPPAVFGAPVSYVDGNAGGVALIATTAGPDTLGFGAGFRLALTSMVGSAVLPDTVRGAAAVGSSPDDRFCGAGADAAGASPAGAGCVDGVCAQAAVLIDEIRIDVDANRCARSDNRSPGSGGQLQQRLKVFRRNSAGDLSARQP
jgi:hypothetical protein